MAQQQANHWLFGAGLHLDFSTTPPTLHQDGKINTYEGCTSIADQSGQLLLYSDGITLWNGRHEVVEGGTDLAGHASSTQSGIIVSQPGHANRFFVFTVDASERALAGGLAYTKVDMAANDGRGKVLRKNQTLLAPTAEKVNGVAHANQRDIWVISHAWNSNAFYAFLITSSGIDTHTVITRLGAVFNGPLSNSIGQMKIAPGGDKLAVALYEDRIVELFDFDNKTGRLTRPRRIAVPTGKPYGLEFSPDGNWLYTGTFFHGEVAQYDARAKKSETLAASRRVIRPADQTTVGALQLGPDGKIYVQLEGVNYLGVVHNPNGQAANCYFREKAIAWRKRTPSREIPTVRSSVPRPWLARPSILRSVRQPNSSKPAKTHGLYCVPTQTRCWS